MSELLLDLLRAKVASVKKVSERNGGEYHSACPSCGGTDRFLCFPNQQGGELAQKFGISGTWACPRHCGTSGDVITFLMEFSGLSFKDACHELKIEIDSKGFRRFNYIKPYSAKKNIEFEAKDFTLPAETWISQATKTALEAHQRLLESPAIMQYLAKRGLSELAVQKYKLGYIEAEDKTGTCIYRPRSAWALPEKINKLGKPIKVLRIPRGITIPLWNKAGQCLRIRIRKRNIDLEKKADSKYILIPQVNPYSKPMALLAKNFSPALTTWLVVEAELDAMAVHFACEQAGLQVSALSVLTLLGKPDLETHKLLQQSPRILVALDFEETKPEATREAFLWWQANYPQAKLYPVPLGKDPGEAFNLGLDLAKWIESALPACSKKRVEQVQISSEQNNSGSLGTSFVEHNIKGPPQFASWDKSYLPESCAFTLEYITNYIKETCCSNKLAQVLIPCPKQKWGWVYKSSCHNSKKTCFGHPLCLYNFIEKIIRAFPL